MEITSFVWSSRINLLHVKRNSDRLVVVAKVFLKLPITYQILAYANKINNAILSFILRYLFLCYIILSFPRNLAHLTFGELLIVLSTKVTLLHLFYLTEMRCAVLLLIN